MSFLQQNNRSSISKPIQQEINRVPRQFSDFMNMQNNRFSEICKIYLDGLSVDDLQYLKPEDFINLVPKNYHKHKLLMTIMVRRYIYNTCDVENEKDTNTVNNCVNDNEI